MAGLGGAYIAVAYRPTWSSGMTQGMGWLAVALTIFSFWNPLYAPLGAYLFGALFHLAFRLQVFVAPEILNSRLIFSRWWLWCSFLVSLFGKRLVFREV